MNQKDLTIVAEVNRYNRAWHERTGISPEQAAYGGEALMRLIATQIAAFQRSDPQFDARRFVKASGIHEDWLQERIFAMASHDTTHIGAT